MWSRPEVRPSKPELKCEPWVRWRAGVGTETDANPVLLPYRAAPA